MTHENVGTGSPVPEDQTTEQTGYQGSEWSSANPYSGQGATSESVDPAAGFATGSVASETGSVTSDAGSIEGHSTTEQVARGVENVKDAAASGAADVKETAMQRGGDVAAVAKDELGRVADEARTQLRSLWGQTSGQLREQASAGKHQLADLLHGLAGELGEMASKSDQAGPLTALARQGAQRGGELSHWLSTADPGDVMAEIRRFARRRPVLFLAGALAAGVVVGRLSRGLMAQDQVGRSPSGPQLAAGQTSAAIAPVYSPTYATPGATPVAEAGDDTAYAGSSTGVIGSTIPPAGTTPAVTEPGVHR